jgi:predicted protein tyrosine phosphatase
MLRITVKSFFKALLSIQQDEFDHHISIVSPCETRCVQMPNNHHIFRFDDIETETLNYKGKDYIGPSFEQVGSLLELTKTFDDPSTVLVHCTAGKSRSTACAIAMYVQAGASADDALEMVIASRLQQGGSLVIPNRRIIRFADEILQQSGMLISAINTHYDRLRISRPDELISRNRHQIED